MKLGSLATPTVAIAAVVVLGAVAAGLVANAVLASEPESQGTPTPTPTATPNPSRSLAPTPEPTAEPVPTATPVVPALPVPPDKPQTLISLEERGTRGTRSAPKAPDLGTVYTWEDGDRTLRVVLQDDLVVQKTADITPEDVVVSKGAKDSIVQKQAKHGQDVLPVFRSESGGGLMTLPGGVLIALDTSWDEDTVESFLSKNGISMDMTSDLGVLKNALVVETEPGFPSLELANELAAQDGVMISSPNWWREVETK